LFDQDWGGTLLYSAPAARHGTMACASQPAAQRHPWPDLEAKRGVQHRIETSALDLSGLLGKPLQDFRVDILTC